jgi:hypothetical protein
VEALADWLVERGITTAAMESTLAPQYSGDPLQAAREILIKTAYIILLNLCHNGSFKRVQWSGR